MNHSSLSTLSKLNRPFPILRFLCQVLSPRESDYDESILRSLITSGKVSWEVMVAVAGEQLVITALWSELSRKGLAQSLPGDLAQALSEMHRLNRRRNNRIKAQVAEMIRHLNGLGLEPLLLKGVVHLYCDLFPDPGGRIIGDIDILMPPEGVAPAVAGLESLGYRTVYPTVIHQSIPLHHLPPMGRPGDVAVVEVHTALSMSVEPELISVGEAWEKADRIAADGLQFRVLSATHSILHNLHHSEIHHHGHARGLISMKSLYEHSYLASKKSTEIEWAEIMALMANKGLGALLSSYLYLANRLFGMPLPPQTGGRLLLSELHFYRCRAQLQLPLLMDIGRMIGTILWYFTPDMIHYKYGCEKTLPCITRGRLQELRNLFAEYILSGNARELVDKVKNIDIG